MPSELIASVAGSTHVDYHALVAGGVDWVYADGDVVGGLVVLSGDEQSANIYTGISVGEVGLLVRHWTEMPEPNLDEGEDISQLAIPAWSGEEFIAMGGMNVDLPPPTLAVEPMPLLVRVAARGRDTAFDAAGPMPGEDVFEHYVIDVAPLGDHHTAALKVTTRAAAHFAVP